MLFINEYGNAGLEQAWHHVVEQHIGNITKFGKEAIHNTQNLIKMKHKNLEMLHNKISAYYSRKQRLLGYKSPREYLKDKSYQEQFDYGIDVINKIVSGEIKVEKLK